MNRRHGQLRAGGAWIDAVAGHLTSALDATHLGVSLNAMNGGLGRTVNTLCDGVKDELRAGAPAQALN